MFMHQNYQKGFDWGEFVSGVLFILLAIYFFRRPGIALSSIVVFAAIIAIMRGIMNLSAYNKFNEIMPGSWLMILSGVLHIIIGLIFLFDTALGSLTIAYMFAIWFLVDSIAGLITSGHLRNFGSGWFIISLIFDILGLIVGMGMLINPSIAAFTMIFLVSWFFLIIGINNVIVAFAHR